MGNEHPKAGKSELNGRLVDTSKLGKTGERQINTVKELEKIRERERQRKEDKAAKKEKRETERDWQIAKQTMNEGMIQHILQPFENLTGINCVADHAEPDEEEEVSDYEQEELEESDSEEEVEA